MHSNSLSLTKFAFFASSALALSTDSIKAIFPGQTDLTGAITILPNFNLTILTNKTHAVFELAQDTLAPYKIGWQGVGVGSAMVNADFLVSWPNQMNQIVVPGANTPAVAAWTLSHRDATGERMPMIASSAAASSTASFYTFLPAFSSNNSSPGTAIVFIRPLAPQNYVTTSPNTVISRGMQSFIFASSSIPPNSMSEDAIISQHDQAHKAIMVDLSQPISLGTTTASSASNSTSSASSEPAGIASTTADTSRTTRDMMLIAHATLVSVAFLVVAPSAIIIARYFRHTNWFVFHAVLNSITLILVMTAFGLTYVATGAPHFEDKHTRVGLAIVIIILLQVLAGVIAHFSRKSNPIPSRLPTLQKKSPIRFIHAFTGLGLVILAWYQIHDGYEEWSVNSDAVTDVPKGVIVIFWILVAFWTIAYFVGWYREYSRGTRLAASEKSDSFEQKA